MYPFPSPSSSYALCTIARRGLYGGLLLFFALLANLDSARAANNGEGTLTIRGARANLGVWILNQSWMPVTVDIGNRSDRTRNAGVVIDVALDTAGGERVRFATSAQIPPHMERTVPLSVLFNTNPGAITDTLSRKEVEQTFPDGTKTVLARYKGKPLTLTVRLYDQQTGSLADESPIMGVPMHPRALLEVTVDEFHQPYTTDDQYQHNGCDYVLGEREGDVTALAPHERRDADILLSANLPGKGQTPAGVTLTRISGDSMPDRWALLEGVNTVYLGGLKTEKMPPSGLTPRQRRSLLRWVRSGGRLVIVPAHDLSTYQHPFWRQLLPVRLLDTRLLGSENATLESWSGRAFHPASPVPARIAEATPAPEGEVLLSHEGNVLLARRKVGGGEVWFSAIPGGAMRRWSGGPAYWSPMVTARVNPLPGLKTTLAEDAPKILSRLAGAVAPRKSLVVRLMAAYILLAIALLLAMRVLGHTEWGWPAMVALSIAVAALAVSLGLAAHRRVGFVTGELGATTLGNGRSHASVTSFIGLHSPGERTLDITWPNPDTLASAHPADDTSGGLRSAITVKQDRTFTFSEVNLRPGKLNLARAATLVSYEQGIQLDAKLDANGLAGSVTNRTGEMLQDCIIRLNRRTYRIGELKDGQTADLAKARPAWDLRGSEYGIGGGEEARLRQWILADCLRNGVHLPEDAPVRTWPVCLYGWTPKPQAIPEAKDIERAPRRRALQLLALPASQLTANGEITVPAGACGIRLVTRGAERLFDAGSQRLDRVVRVPRAKRIAGMKRRAGKTVRAHRYGRAELPLEKRIRPPGWASGKGTAIGEIEFVLPEPLHQLDIEQIEILADILLTDMDAEVHILNHRTGAYEPLFSKRLGNGPQTITLRTPQPYLGDGGQLPRLRVRIDNSARSQIGTWNIKTLDIRLRGQMPDKQAKR